MHIPEFQPGSNWRSWRAKLNAIIRALRDLTHLRGDGLVKISHVPGAGYTFGLNMRALIERMPKWRRRHGVAQIDSNDGSGAYTITERVWNPNADTPAWEDGVAPVSYVSKAARDYQDRPGGIVDQTVTFWEQRATDGTLEVLIDVSGAGEPLWGKATAAWTSGNTVTLDPCDSAGVDNGRPNVTAYAFTPTDTVPGDGAIALAIAADDVLAYLPFGANKGILVNPPVAVTSNMFAVRTWWDGGDQGTRTAQATCIYTARTLDATAHDAGGTLLGEDMAPECRNQATLWKGRLDNPPSTGVGWIGLGYYGADDAFHLWDAGERPHTDPCPI